MDVQCFCLLWSASFPIPLHLKAFCSWCEIKCIRDSLMKSSNVVRSAIVPSWCRRHFLFRSICHYSKSVLKSPTLCQFNIKVMQCASVTVLGSLAAFAFQTTFSMGMITRLHGSFHLFLVDNYWLASGLLPRKRGPKRRLSHKIYWLNILTDISECPCVVFVAILSFLFVSRSQNSSLIENEWPNSELPRWNLSW